MRVQREVSHQILIPQTQQFDLELTAFHLEDSYHVLNNMNIFNQALLPTTELFGHNV